MARRGQEKDSHAEVEAAPAESAPFKSMFRPVVAASQSGMSPTRVKPLPHAGPSGQVRTKAEHKTPPSGLSSTVIQVSSPQHSGTESFDLSGDEGLHTEDPNEMVKAEHQDG